MRRTSIVSLAKNLLYVSHHKIKFNYSYLKVLRSKKKNENYTTNVSSSDKLLFRPSKYFEVFEILENILSKP